MAQTQFWLNEGTIVGNRYSIEKVLGKGGYGITYKGMDTRLKLPVAVKEYYPVFWCSRFTEKGLKVNVNEGMLQDYCKGMDRFHDEAMTLAQLGNVSGIVRVTDFFEENGTAYLVMEYLDGKNLKEMLDGFGGRIPANVLIPVLSPVLFALRKVHEKGLIHRDLSPDNIMMLEDGSVRLIDFGNARDTTDNKSMTLAMKEGFAAPEQYRSKGQGTYTDVYGMCATIYYCLTGKLPPQAMERLMGAPFLKPSEMGVDIADWQEQAIMDGLELYLQKRIQNMEELWQRLYVEPERPAPEPQPEPQSIPQPVAQPVSGNAQSADMWNASMVDFATSPSESAQNYGGTAPQGQYTPPYQPSYYQQSVPAQSRDAGDSLSDSLHHLKNVCAQIFKKIKEW